MDLEQYRTTNSLSYADLAQQLRWERNKAYRTALGKTWDAEAIQQVLDRFPAVTLEAMHRRRLAYLRSLRGRPEPGEFRAAMAA